jgi:Resolvase, N terminal domain
MKAPPVKPVRCAIYTRVSTEHGLDQEFNSLDAQYDAASAYIKSQAHAGWTLIRSRYDDGGYSGGSTDRPDLQRLLAFVSRKLGDNRTLRGKRTRLIFPVSGLGQRNGTRAPNPLLLCTPQGPTMSRFPSGRVLPPLK